MATRKRVFRVRGNPKTECYPQNKQEEQHNGFNEMVLGDHCASGSVRAVGAAATLQGLEGKCQCLHYFRMR